MTHKGCGCDNTKSAPSKLSQMISGLRLFPKTHDFFGLMEQSARNVVKGTELLCQMIENKARREELLVQLKDCEHDGDKITHDTIDLVHSTFLTPFDRTDMRKLLVKMDDVLDRCHSTGNRLTKYNVTEMPDELFKLAQTVRRAAGEILGAVSGLRNIKNVQTVLNHCREINRLEREADELINAAFTTLFDNSWDPLEVIKLKELAEIIEAAADKSKNVSDIIEGIILKNT